MKQLQAQHSDEIQAVMKRIDQINLDVKNQLAKSEAITNKIELQLGMSVDEYLKRASLAKPLPDEEIEQAQKLVYQFVAEQAKNLSPPAKPAKRKRVYI